MPLHGQNDTGQNAPDKMPRDKMPLNKMPPDKMPPTVECFFLFSSKAVSVCCCMHLMKQQIA